jgi:Ca2+/Na+ antiporter
MRFSYKNSQRKYILTALGIPLSLLALSTPVLFLIKQNLAAILILVAYVFFILYIILTGKRKLYQQSKDFEKWKNEAHQIKVSLLDYTIQSNSWVDEIVVNKDWRIQAFNQLTGNADRNLEKIARNPNYVNLNLDLEGEPYQHRFYIDKDVTTLKVLLELKAATWVYIDKNDATKKYVDLEFLYH